MKNFAKACLIICSLSITGFALWAGCKPGNIEYLPVGGVPQESLCCVPVGDGSVLSCTDGETWQNVPSIDTVE